MSLTGVLSSACSSEPESSAWTDQEVTFEADGITLHGTYRHREGQTGPAALLISESGNTDRNGDNQVAGPIGNMRQLAELLSERDVASLRYDKIGTGRTGLGRYSKDPAAVVSGVYTDGARSAAKFLADQPDTEDDRISVYGLGEGTIHALALAGDTAPDAPKVHSLGLLQPLPGRYLDIITARVEADGAPETVATWQRAVEQIRTAGTVPEDLPDGLTAIVNPANVAAVVEADRIDPLALAAAVPAGTPVLLTCSDVDSQARCAAMAPLADALSHTDLTLVELTGVNHVLRDDPTDSIANYAKKAPLSPQVVEALEEFAGK
ncbi:hypothetical protein ACQI4F_23965 [Mycolicibacterium vaccae]|uniref:hypothetical protein n=1 Tax=Mycolicibacterium vaccae TaxID=1810 RepID=UPI003CF37A68